jgi:hypothetical protein
LEPLLIQAYALHVVTQLGPEPDCSDGARDGRESDSARGQIQKLTALNFHCTLPLPSRVSYRNKSRPSGEKNCWLLMTRSRC